MEYRKFAQACGALLLSREFRELGDALKPHEPNLWHILGISRKEIRISRFLAWLLDPQSNHSWKDQFLKSLVVRALQADINHRDDLKPVHVLVMDLSDVEVSTEYKLGVGKCDILALSPTSIAGQGRGFLCIIENKISAKEAPGQTEYYYQESRAKFHSEQYPHRVYIYLSPDGDPPQNQHFIPLSYQDVLQVIKELLARQQGTQTERFLLQQFQENILRGIAMDPKTIDLARTVYDQYQDVFDLVFDVVKKEQEDGTSATKQNWDGKSRFFNIGDDRDSGYCWEDCCKYNFICAGGGSLYRNWMEQLKVGDIIYAYVSKRGYVGIATVTHKAVPFRDARLDNGRLLSDMKLDGEYNASEDDDTCDWIAFVKWEYKVGKDQAVRREPITRATTSRIYDHRKDVIGQVESELAKRSA